MRGSLNKYFGARTTTEEHSNTYWSNFCDYPIRGASVLLKGDEIEQLPINYDAKSVLLVLPEESGRYDEVIDKCANGLWQLRHERFYEDHTTGKLKVFLAWLEVYGKAPTTPEEWERMKHANRQS